MFIRKKFKIILIIFISFISFKSSNVKSIIINEYISNINKKEEINYYDIFMVLEIPKLKLQKEIFDFNSDLNDVSKNILLVQGSTMPNKMYSNVILASHSGNSDISYFKNLDKLIIGDYANLYYEKNKYEYKLVDIYNENKDGTIVIHRDKKQDNLVLITCDRKNNNLQNVYIFERI